MHYQANETKLYGQNALLQAIDFFTQKFNITQLSSYAFEFITDILALDSSALFIKEGEYFVLKKAKNYNVMEYRIMDNARLQRIATLYGNVMTSGFENYFESKDLEAFHAVLIIPLIIKDLLFGFIISNGKANHSIEDEDITMSKALMQLINNSLESSKNFSDLQCINKQLDQKIFNLFSINHSSRMLLSELDLNRLYSLAIDIFSELTSSRITSFGLYDEIKDSIILRGYKDVFSNNKHTGVFKLKSNSYKGYKLVFHIEKDRLLLENIFENYLDFKQLEAEYIILIVKEQVLGFVTISKPVNDRDYDQSLFELIESLAASTYISFKNAIYFNEIDTQRKAVQQKLQTLTNLNTLIKNINSCLSIEELCDIAVKTLHHSFGFKKAFIALKDKGSYTIKNYIGFELSNDKLELSASWSDIRQEAFACYMEDAFDKYFTAELSSDIGSCNCLVISPVSMGSADIDDTEDPLGYLVVLQAPQNLKEEEVLLIETMSNSIAPVINHLQELRQIKQEYIVNQKEAFLKSLKNKFSNREKYYIDFYIYYKKLVQIPFEQLDLSCYNQYEHYYFDNLLVVISYEQLEDHSLEGSIEASDAEDAIIKLKAAYLQYIEGGHYYNC